MRCVRFGFYTLSSRASRRQQWLRPLQFTRSFRVGSSLEQPTSRSLFGTCPGGGTHGCDNLSFVQNINGVFPFTLTLDCEGFRIPDKITYDEANFSNRTLVPHWDVLVTIHHSLVLLPFPLQLQHVRGHHDNILPYTLLPLL